MTTRKLTVGFVLDDGLDSTDGVQQHVLLVGKWLADRGHTVHYLVGQTQRKDIANLHQLSRNWRISSNQNRMTVPLLASRKTISRLFAQHHFDVLHVQMPYSPTLASRVISAAPRDTAVVGTFHILLTSKLLNKLAPMLRLIQFRSLRRFDRVLSVSAPAADLAKSMYGLASSVIPNPVELKKFSTGRRMAPYRTATTIVFLGRLVERKGADHLLRAFAGMRQANNVRLLIAGKGPLLPNLIRLAEDLGISERTEFLGFVAEKDKPDLLASADIAVFPSTGGESFGIVLAEAMAARAGVVLAGNNPGYASVMHDNPGYLIDPTDTKAFAKRLDKLASQPALRQRLHVSQQALVKQYDISVVGKSLLTVYEQALRSRRRMS